MEVGKLTVNVRTQKGKGYARGLREKGQVPGVCYGASRDGRVDPQPIIVDVKALKAALDPVRKQNTVIELTIVGGAGGQRVLSALLKEYQLDQVRREVTHVDLLAIDPSKEVVTEVPIEFVGKPLGAVDGGQLRLAMRSLTVRAKPSDIPVKLPVDVSALEIGDALHVSDVKLPPGVTVLTGRDLAVVSCAAPEEEKIETPVVDPLAAAAAVPGAPGAPGAAPGAPGAAGAAPAAGAAAPAAAGGKPGAAPAAGAKPGAAPAAKGGGDKGGKK